MSSLPLSDTLAEPEQTLGSLPEPTWPGTSDVIATCRVGAWNQKRVLSLQMVLEHAAESSFPKVPAPTISVLLKTPSSLRARGSWRQRSLRCSNAQEPRNPTPLLPACLPACPLQPLGPWPSMPGSLIYTNHLVTRSPRFIIRKSLLTSLVSHYNSGREAGQER